MQAMPYFDRVDKALIYAFDLPGKTGKVVVRVNYKDKFRQDGERRNELGNFIRTGGLVDANNLGQDRYIPLRKKP